MANCFTHPSLIKTKSTKGRLLKSFSTLWRRLNFCSLKKLFTETSSLKTLCGEAMGGLDLQTLVLPSKAGKNLQGLFAAQCLTWRPKFLKGNLAKSRIFGQLVACSTSWLQDDNHFTKRIELNCNPRSSWAFLKSQTVQLGARIWSAKWFVPTLKAAFRLTNA